MSFFDSSTTTKVQKSAIDQEIDSLIKARGFEPGTYKFEPNSGVQRPEGSIINGRVKGKFTMSGSEIEDFIVLDREDFPRKAWKKLCSALGFKYHNHTDIDRFTILPNSIDVDVSIVTPLEDV